MSREPMNPEEQYEDDERQSFEAVRDAARLALSTEYGLRGIIDAVLVAYQDALHEAESDPDAQGLPRRGCAFALTRAEAQARKQAHDQEQQILEGEHAILEQIHAAFHRAATEEGSHDAVRLIEMQHHALTRELLAGWLEEHDLESFVQLAQDAAGDVQRETDEREALALALTPAPTVNHTGAASERRLRARFQDAVLRYQMRGLLSLLEGLKPAVEFLQLASRTAAEREISPRQTP